MKPRTFVALAALLAASVLGALPADAQITSVTVRVDGLSCPFCAYGLEKRIKMVQGTKAPVINVEEGTVTLTPVGDASVDFDGLREAVKKAGFTPREISVEGVGRVAAIDMRPTLVAESGQPLFLLAPNDVLASLQESDQVVIFRGTLAPRQSRPESASTPPQTSDDDEAPLRTLVLLSASPRGKGDVN